MKLIFYLCKGNGTATITATTQSGKKTATVVITVNIVPVVSDKPAVPTDTDQTFDIM